MQNPIRPKSSDYPLESFLTQLGSTAMRNQFKRLNSIKDPVLRYSLFLETIRTIFLIGTEGVELSVNERIELLRDADAKAPQESEHVRHREMDHLAKTLNNLRQMNQEMEAYFDGFSQWIIQPTYSPDHPMGNRIMHEAEKDYQSKQEERISK